MNEDPALARGLNTFQGQITHNGVSCALGLSPGSMEEAAGRWETGKHRIAQKDPVDTRLHSVSHLDLQGIYLFNVNPAS